MRRNLTKENSFICDGSFFFLQLSLYIYLTQGASTGFQRKLCQYTFEKITDRNYTLNVLK